MSTLIRRKYLWSEFLYSMECIIIIKVSIYQHCCNSIVVANVFAIPWYSQLLFRILSMWQSIVHVLHNICNSEFDSNPKKGSNLAWGFAVTRKSTHIEHLSSCSCNDRNQSDAGNRKLNVKPWNKKFHKYSICRRSIHCWNLWNNNKPTNRVL